MHGGNGCDEPLIVFVDHSGLPGGGQLGLARYLKQSTAFRRHVVILDGGPAFDDADVEVTKIVVGESRWRYPLAIRSLRRLLLSLSPNLVVANSVRAACVLALIGTPGTGRRVYYMRDDLNPARNSFAKRFVMAHFVLPRFGFYVANSRWTASTLPRALARRPVMIAHPVSGALACSDRVSTARGNGSVFRVLSLSRLAPWKGIHCLIEAIGMLEERGFGSRVQLTIAGSSFHADPEYQVRLHQRASGLTSFVQFVGHVDDVSGLLAESDCLVCVSMTPEPFGQVVAQGMQAGLVVIAGNEGGPAEQITDGVSGLLVRPGSAEAIADSLERLICDPQLCAQVGVAARVAADRFSDEVTVGELDSAILSVLDSEGFVG